MQPELVCELSPDCAACPVLASAAFGDGAMHSPGPGRQAFGHGSPANSSAAQVAGKKTTCPCSVHSLPHGCKPSPERHTAPVGHLIPPLSAPPRS